MKKFATYSKGKKTGIIVGIIAAVLIVGLVLFSIFKPEPAVDVILEDVKKGSITQELAATAAVESGNRKTYNIPNGTLVKTVNVKVGDKVKKGDVLATFDIASLNSILAERQSAYNEAVNTRKNADAAAAQAKNKLPSVKKEIAALEKKVADLEKKNASASAPKTTEPATSQSGNNNQQNIQDIINKILGSNGTAGQIKDLMDKLNQLAAGGMDLSKISGGSAELIQAQMDLAQLKMQKSVLEAQSGNAMGSVYDTAVKVTKASLDEIKNDIASLKNGWVAETDGIITSVNIAAGQTYQSGQNTGAIDFNSVISTIMSSGADTNGLAGMLQSLTSGGNIGMTVDGYDDFYVTVPVGKYDLSRVKVGQKAIIKTVENEYEGEVVYLSPVAEQDANMSISSITSSLTGGSTSSSVNAKIKINNPGNDVIIGIDVEITIITNEKSDAVLIPVEAVKTIEDRKFVFVYKPEDKIVRKTEIRIGLANDTVYEVVAGLNAGEQVVKNPKNELTDKSRVKIQKEEVSTDSAIYLDEQ